MRSTAVLKEALPYIQEFHGQTFVIKLSGALAEDSTQLLNLAEEIALLHYVGIKVSGNPDGWRIGIEELKRATGLSGPSLWRAAARLDAAGLVHKRRDGVNRWTLCDGHCEACSAKKTPVNK